MNREMIETQIADIVRKTLILDKEIEILPNSNLQDALNMSSIDIIQVILEIESEFGIEFDEEYLTIENLSCVHSIAMVVKKLMTENPQSYKEG